MAVFKSYKLDDMQASKRKLEDLRSSGGEHVYFAKFLTSEKVRDLLTPRKICNSFNFLMFKKKKKVSLTPMSVVCVFNHGSSTISVYRNVLPHYYSLLHLQLMDLQLSDSNFRRHILLQYLILFQYLKGQVKFKR